MLTKQEAKRILTTHSLPVPEVRQRNGSSDLILIWTGTEPKGNHENKVHRLCDGLKELCFVKLHPNGYRLETATITFGTPYMNAYVHWTITFKATLVVVQ